ncbi:MAG TPA: type II secretion system protein GspJ [Legionella sp.]|nr:type II secretion system protein GspJ [Legionella sp.]
MKRVYGFTLIEILIALAVFAILAAITSSAIYHAFNTRTRVTLQADRLSSLQLAIAILNQDTQQIVARSVRRNQHLSAAFIGQPHYVEFTRGGHTNPDGRERRSTLIRVAFLCTDTALIRRRWDMLDSPSRNAYQDKILLDHLTKCQFAYLAQNQQLSSHWTKSAVQPNQPVAPLPAAIQFTAHVTDWGKMSLLFQVKGGVRAK